MDKIKPKAEMIEGLQAKDNFERTMKAIIQVPKAEVEKAEKEYRVARKRKNPKASASRVPGACA